MPSDITDAPTQDAIAESLLGPEEQPVEQPVAEQQPETPVEEQPVEQEQPQEQPEAVENWLPSEQDKTFSEEALSRYAQRYGFDEQSLTNPQLRQLIVDKINSDIFIHQQQQLEAEQFVEPEPQPEPTRTQPELTREQYFQQLDQLVSQRTDPNVAKDFYTGFMKVFGVPDQEIAKNAAQAVPFTQLMTKYALNMVNSFLPDFLQAQLATQISQAFPGFGEMYERSSYAMAWDRVRNSNPVYADLPAYGSKQFSQQLREAAAKIPGFDEMQFTDGQGRPLSPMENSTRKYGMLAQAIKGQITPELLNQAVAAKTKSIRRAEVRRSAGQLGSGQSTRASGGSGSGRFQSNSDLFDEETMERYQNEHGRL
jgi:hypothetical protein